MAERKGSRTSESCLEQCQEGADEFGLEIMQRFQRKNRVVGMRVAGTGQHVRDRMGT